MILILQNYGHSLNGRHRLSINSGAGNNLLIKFTKQMQ